MSPQHATDLAAKIQQLQADRQRHVEAMATIDRVLGQINDALRAAPGASPSSSLIGEADGVIRREVPAGALRQRGRFHRTGIDSVLDFIRRHGDPSTAEINAHWRSEGRKGTANVTLLKLLKDNLVRREQDASVRGSRYRLAHDEPASRPAHVEVTTARV